MKRILYYQSPSDLSDLAEAALALTPKVSLPRANHLYLEISSTKKYFGGEAAILFQADNVLSPFGLSLRRVMTDRPEWARAFATCEENLIPPGQSRGRLYELPVERVIYCGDPTSVEEPEEWGERLDLVTFMKRVGMRTIRDFAELSPAALLRRFGKLGGVIQEWVKGHRECSLPIFTPSEVIREKLDTDDIVSLDELLFSLRTVLVKVETRLRGRGQLAKKIRLLFHLQSRTTLTRDLGLSEPLWESQDLLKLFRDFLNGMTWNSPLERLEIEITDVVASVKGQLSLFDKTENQFHDLAQFVSRLRARFGAENAGFPALKQSHLPERSWELVWPPPKDQGLAPPLPERPLFLYSPPRSHPPPRQSELVPSENLMAEWWENGGHRRYFISKNSRGERLWLFFDCEKREWFLHGSFD